MSPNIATTLEPFFERFPSTIGRDLKLNFKKLTEGSGPLGEAESSLTVLAVATSLALPALAEAASRRLEQLDFTAAQIEEAAESAAIMGMLNTYYRFRHQLTEKDPSLADQYRNAGLRMTALAKPQLGKERFEMLAFAVSVVNGCQTCIVAHEKTLREAGIAVDKIHDLARLAAVIKGMQALMSAKPS